MAIWLVILLAGGLSTLSAHSRRLLEDDQKACYAHEDSFGERQNSFDCGEKFCCGDATYKYCCTDSSLAILALDNPDLEDWDAAEKESRKNIDVNPYDYIIPVACVTAFAVTVIVIILCVRCTKRERIHDIGTVRSTGGTESKGKKEKKKFNKRKKKNAASEMDWQINDKDVPVHESGQPTIYHIEYPEDDPYHLPPIPPRYPTATLDGANGNVSPSSSAVWKNDESKTSPPQQTNLYSGNLYDVRPPSYSVAVSGGNRLYSVNHVDINSM